MCGSCGRPLAPGSPSAGEGAPPLPGPIARHQAAVIVSAALAVLVIAVVAVVVVVTRDGSAPATTGEVRPDQDNVVTSADGDVSVEIPRGAVTEAGRLTIEPVSDAQGHPGWAISLADTTLVGQATIRFATPELTDGEPMPLVWSRATLDGPAELASDVSVDDGAIVVGTEHFSTWFVDGWNDLLEAAKKSLEERLDAAASITPDRAPKCKGEAAVRDAGYQVSSDSGRRVYWCLGLEGDVPTLKATNARGYGVASEYTPGLSVTEQDSSAILDLLAGLLTPPPTKRGNTTVLLASGNTIRFAIDPGNPLVGVRFTPDPGAYLVSALQFAVDTFTFLMDRLGVKGTLKKLVAVLKGEQCLSAFSELATTELATPQEAQEFFGHALDLSFDCVGSAAKEIDLGFISNVIVEPLLWLFSGLKTAADGVIAAADLGFDTDGYQIRVGHEVAPAISQASVEGLLIPAGTCGGPSDAGWNQLDPIQLSAGEGESFDDSGEGAGILATRLVGAVDVTGDGVDEAVVALTCTGSPQELCCAGRTSLMDFVAVLDLHDGTVRRVGDTIMPVDVPVPGPSPRQFHADEVSLDGSTVVTYQTLVYPEQLDPDEVAALEGEVRYTLQGDHWVPSVTAESFVDDYRYSVSP